MLHLLQAPPFLSSGLTPKSIHSAVVLLDHSLRSVSMISVVYYFVMYIQCVINNPNYSCITYWSPFTTAFSVKDSESDPSIDGQSTMVFADSILPDKDNKIVLKIKQNNCRKSYRSTNGYIHGLRIGILGMNKQYPDG